LAILFDRELYQKIILDRVLKAGKFIWIATANIKDLHIPEKGRRRAHSFLADLSKLAGNGVAIRILYSSEPSRRFKKSFDRFRNLIEGGVELQPCTRLHCKLVVVDGALAYLGSANFTGAGLGARSDRRRNFEAGYVTRDPGEVRAVMDYFDGIWMGGRCPACGLKKVCEDPMA
jgi:phosphatidylserine/phosphatidylglycerophosphate/cardiolipin synthase-like enzyme